MAQSDLTAMIRLASTLPVGSPERRAILAGCEKLPAGGMRDNCEKSKENGGVGKSKGKKDEKEDGKKDKKKDDGKMPADLLEKFKGKKKAAMERSAMIHLAASLPAGDESRRTLLASLSQTAAGKWKKGDRVQVESVKPASKGSNRFLAKIKDYGIIEVEFSTSGLATSLGNHPDALASAAIKAVKKDNPRG
jgi:hypothetical protein